MNSDRRADERVGGDGGIVGAGTRGAEIDSGGTRVSVKENLRSGFRGLGVPPTTGWGEGAGAGRGSGGIDESGSCSKSSRKGLQKYNVCSTEFA